MELRLPVETVEVGADELAVLHTHAHVVDQVGHAPGGVDLIVGTTAVRVFASNISTWFAKPFSRTRMRANRAYGEVYVM